MQLMAIQFSSIRSMAVHIHGYLIQVRIYDEGVDVNKPLHKMTKKYTGIVSILIDEFGIARASHAIMDKLTVKDFKTIVNYCRDNGAIKFTYKHRDLEREIDLRNIHD